MRRGLLAGIAATALLFGSQALAQSVSVQINPDQRTKIKQYVVKEKVAPITVRERLAIGATLPANVELRTVPADWGPGLTRYRYIYSDNNVYLVEPSNRTVVHVID